MRARQVTSSTSHVVHFAPKLVQSAEICGDFRRGACHRRQPSAAAQKAQVLLRTFTKVRAFRETSIDQ